MRPRVRSMSVILVDGYEDLAADAMRERGRPSPVQYEATWWGAYERV